MMRAALETNFLVTVKMIDLRGARMDVVIQVSRGVGAGRQEVE